VKLIRVVVIEVSATNRTEVDKAVKKLQGELQSKWTPIVIVPEDNVNIYAMGDASGEATSGLGLLVYDGGDLVIGNVVGHVSIGKLLQIATRKNNLPKDLLNKLLRGGGAATAQAAPKTAGAGGDAATKTPAETPATEQKEPARK
jgi:hypothetical protein